MAEITTWTVRNSTGKIIDKDIQNIIEYLKRHREIFVLVRLEAIKELIIV